MVRALPTTPPRALRGPLHLWRARSADHTSVPATHVRPRRARDVPACARLLRRALFEGQFPGHGPQSPRAWLEGDDVLAAYVAVHDGELVGHVAVSLLGDDPRSTNRWRELTGRPSSDLLAVSCLFVRPCMRGKGYGSALLEAATADIRARRLLPTIDVVSNTWTAPHVYVDRGWKLRASDPRGDGLWVHRLEGPATV